MSKCVCLVSEQCLRKLVGIQCLNPGFLRLEETCPTHSTTNLPICPISPKQVGVPLFSQHRLESPVISRWSGKESSERRSPGARTPPPSTSFYILCIYLRGSFPQRPPVSEQVLCSVSCSRTLQWQRKM